MIIIIIVTERQREIHFKYGPPPRTPLCVPSLSAQHDHRRRIRGRAACNISTNNFHRPLCPAQRYSGNVNGVSTPA
jgi:hypothetical protein